MPVESEKPITVHRNDVGLETVGFLTMDFNWRVSRRIFAQAAKRPTSSAVRPWHRSCLALPLDEISVAPNSVLFWDADPSRANSIKRFAYMLGNRAVPQVVVGGNTTRNLNTLVINPSEAQLLGYAESRDQIVDMTRQYFTNHLGHIRRENSRAIYRYDPPEDTSERMAIRDLLLRNRDTAS